MALVKWPGLGQVSVRLTSGTLALSAEFSALRDGPLRTAEMRERFRRGIKVTTGENRLVMLAPSACVPIQWDVDSYTATASPAGGAIEFCCTGAPFFVFWGTGTKLSCQLVVHKLEIPVTASGTGVGPTTAFLLVPAQHEEPAVFVEADNPEADPEPLAGPRKPAVSVQLGASSVNVPHNHPTTLYVAGIPRVVALAWRFV
jgi:hypothetical protein